VSFIEGVVQVYLQKCVTIPLLFAVGVAITGCSSDEANQSSGAKLYKAHCASCHKESGGGNFLAGVPANNATNLSGGEIIGLILYGDPRFPRMPQFPQLDPNQARAIALYMKER